MKDNIREIDNLLCKTINNKRTQSLYPHIMIEVIFNKIFNKDEEVIIAENDAFIEFYAIAREWVIDYKLDLCEESVVNKIIKREEDRHQAIDKIMESRVGKRLIKNITKYNRVFQYDKDKREIVVSNEVTKRINENMDYWKKVNFGAAKEALLKYNVVREEAVDQLFRDKKYLR